MSNVIPLLAQALTPLDPQSAIQATPPGKLFGMAMRDMLLLGGVVLVLANLLFLWAYLTHKRRRRHHHGHSRALYQAEPGSHEGHGPAKFRRKRRRREHPDNLPRNPTLAEAGGLPPVRPEEPPSEPTQ